MRLVRRMYAWRLGEIVPDTDLDALRGLEGARMRETYKLLARQFGIEWAGRRYDRQNPEAADLSNQAVNHAATAVEAAAMVAVAVTGAMPQLGFIHEDSGLSFCLDIADLCRHSVTLPIAFGAVREWHRARRGAQTIEQMVRKLAGRTFRKERLIPKMIDQIKELFADDSGSNP
jgi:CRISPR-associated protein Cas1